MGNHSHNRPPHPGRNKRFRVVGDRIIEEGDWDETDIDELYNDPNHPHYRGRTVWGLLPGSLDDIIDDFRGLTPVEIAFKIHFGKSWRHYKNLITKAAKKKPPKQVM